MVILNDNKSPSLLSYKYHIRPNAHRLYGTLASKSKHSENVQKIIKMLALEGPLTTWDMARIKFANDINKIRTKEKEYRRLLIGRIDRGKHSEGIVDLNIVLVDSKSTKRNSGNIYRLSLFGILYCLDEINFSEKEIDKLAKNYEIILPLIFGKWDFLKSMIGDNIYNIALLGKGLLFDNPNIISIKNDEFYELISYFGIKSNILTESFNEQKIGNLISLWFYITLLYFPNLMNQKSKNNKKYLKKILENDPEIKKWFLDFIIEAQMFYKKRSKILNSIEIV
ncbi:MAG TPA: hypothetical protein VLD64_05815 [Nitrosarchaeum sp.]|jgi:hypothetical protein|nr:hypothetical protein [Nitrosarchaeum sp.]